MSDYCCYPMKKAIKMGWVKLPKVLLEMSFIFFTVGTVFYSLEPFKYCPWCQKDVNKGLIDHIKKLMEIKHLEEEKNE